MPNPPDPSADSAPADPTPEERFDLAKAEYQALIDRDFPDFDLEAFAEARAAEAAAAEPAGATGRKDERVSLRERVRRAVDRTGDGKVDLADGLRAAREAADAGAKVGRAAVAVAARSAQATGEAIRDFDAAQFAEDAKGAAAAGRTAIANIDVGETLGTATKIGKTAVGMQGIQERRAAKQINDVCGEYYDAAEAITEQRREQLNGQIQGFGSLRLMALHGTLGRFLMYLEQLKQRNATREYELLAGADISNEALEKLQRIDMAASQALRSTAISGALGAAAVMGTPALVTGAVGALATASTGTAISSLSGAAATNAVMAWLGGGSLAAGGGGMAAGAIVLTGITAGATAAMVLLSAGTIISLHYGRKLTEAKEYEKNVGLAVANLEKAWIVMDGISMRIEELSDVTQELERRTIGALDELVAVIPAFDFHEPAHAAKFQKAGQLVKTMVELAQTPLLDEAGGVSVASMTIAAKVRRVMNAEV